jgi:hypothetical protein
MGDLFPCGHGKPCPIHSYDLYETAKIQRIQVIAVDKYKESIVSPFCHDRL